MTPVSGPPGGGGPSRAEVAGHVVMERRPSRSGTLNSSGPRRFSLPDRFRHFVGFAEPDTDWPRPSPTTTSAEKLKRRPTLTTFATRSMCTSLSTNSLSRPRRPPWPVAIPSPTVPCDVSPSVSYYMGSATRSTRGQDPGTALASGIGQRLDAAVERDRRHGRRSPCRRRPAWRALRGACRPRRRSAPSAPVLSFPAHFLLDARRRRDAWAAHIVFDDLRSRRAGRSGRPTGAAVLRLVLTLMGTLRTRVSRRAALGFFVCHVSDFLLLLAFLLAERLAYVCL